MHASVRLTSADGRSETVSFDTAIPADDLDAQETRLRLKFDTLAIPIVGDARAKDLADAIGSVATLPSIADLTPLLRDAG